MRIDLRAEGFHIGRDGKMSAVEHQTKRALYDGKVTLWERELKRVSITGFIDNSELWPGLIDMRLFGLTNNHSLSSTKLIEPEIRSDRPSSIEAANGVTRFTWRSSGFMRIVTVDPQWDFVVKEMEIRQLAGDGDADIVKEKTLSKSVIEWDRQNSVAVPVKAVHEELSGDPRTIRQTIRWETVNSVIDSKVFSVDGFGLPDGTVVGDETTTPTRRGMIREGKAQFKPAVGNPKRMRKPAASGR
jgi:hypothetical protein